MITSGDTTSTLELVQVLNGIGSVPSGDAIDPDWVLDVAQWEPTGEYFVSFRVRGAVIAAQLPGVLAIHLSPNFAPNTSLMAPLAMTL